MKVRSWDLIFYVKDSISSGIKVYGELHMDSGADYKVYGLLIPTIEELYGKDENYIAMNSKKFRYTSILKQFL